MMTWLASPMNRLLLILAAALLFLIGSVVWAFREPDDEAADYDDELDRAYVSRLWAEDWDSPEDSAHDAQEAHHETLRDLRPADLGPVDDGGMPVPPGDAPDRPGDQAAAGEDAGASAMRGADRGLVAVPGRLTPAQRRRAVHKGRIPRTSPAVAAPAAGVASLPGPAVAQANASADRRAGELHQHDERLPAPLTIYDPMHRRHMPVFGSLVESVAWEARRAEDEHWLGAQLDEFEEWWAAPGRWELVA